MITNLSGVWSISLFPTSFDLIVLCYHTFHAIRIMLEDDPMNYTLLMAGVSVGKGELG